MMLTFKIVFPPVFLENGRGATTGSRASKPNQKVGPLGGTFWDNCYLQIMVLKLWNFLASSRTTISVNRPVIIRLLSKSHSWTTRLSALDLPELKILSFAGYCRCCAVRRRLGDLLHDYTSHPMFAALGGVDPRYRVLFCRETVHDKELHRLWKCQNLYRGELVSCACVYVSIKENWFIILAPKYACRCIIANLVPNMNM